MKLSAVILLALLLVGVHADMYLHSPPGSNDRNRERNDDRNNANMLFDSQNNARGGYPWRGNATTRAAPDPLVYYTGSVMTFEWTNQHACGPNPNTYCEVVIQYGHDDLKNTETTNLPGLRDGWPDSAEVQESDNANPGYLRRPFSTTLTCTTTGTNQCTTQNTDGTNTIPDNGFQDNAAARRNFYYEGGSGGIQFAMHEGIDYYRECTQTSRNRGLYTADQQLNQRSAVSTRQNPNGGRRGLECPEERDYYPYWRFTPWNDLAILTSNAALCDYYQQNSQNVKSVEYCNCGQAARDGNDTLTCNVNQNNGVIPIDKQTCLQINGKWITDPRTVKNLDKPDCQYHAFGRDNHLGNALAVDGNGQLQLDPSGEPVTATYQWKVPDSLAGKRVVLRFRYNISTYDYPPYNHTLYNTSFFDASRNCPNGVATTDGSNVDDLQISDTNQCYNDPKYNLDNRPLVNRPYVKVFDHPINLSIALNTHQSGRTFQDRSYVFRVENRPSGVSGNIINLNVRGRRGNIVQCYPAVEYDFVPQRLSVSQGDYLHIQFHGSDFNAQKNANNGEGWQFSDRFNMIQTDNAGVNFPVPTSRLTMFNLQAARTWAFLNQDPTNCQNFKAGQTNEQNSIKNCGKLNQAPNRFPQNPADGLVRVDMPAGTYNYVSTRNNNFSNRSQKAILTVTSSSSVATATIVAAVFGSVAGVALIFGGLLFYGKKNTNSCAGSLYKSVSNCGPSKKTASTGPDMEYQRHATGTTAAK